MLLGPFSIHGYEVPYVTLPGITRHSSPPLLRLASAVYCKSCGSENVGRFPAEIAVHFPGLRNLDKPHVYVRSELIVCLICGAAQFPVPEPELRLLAKGRSDDP
jgi:hypothetical protein